MEGKQSANNPTITVKMDTAHDDPSTATSTATQTTTGMDHVSAGLSEMFVSTEAEKLEQESDDGNVEYKLKLIDPSEERFERLVTQLKFRLAEGSGEALYELGVGDDGTPYGLNDTDLKKSVETLDRMAKELNASTNIVHVKPTKTEGFSIVEVLVRSNPEQNQTPEIRVAVIGNVDAGKSTTIGVLTKGILDNGRGLARANCFKHKHEVDSGRTSSVSQQYLGFDGEGTITNYAIKNDGSTGRNNSIKDIITKSAKIVNFVDLCGHERYLKTTVFGMAGSAPDCSMILIGANMGVKRMTKEHLGLTLALRLPFFIVFTKMDLAPQKIYEENLAHITKVIKHPSIKKIPYMIENEEGVITCSKQMVKGTNIVPIFCISNTTGDGLDNLKLFLNLLPSKKEWSEMRDQNFEFYVDHTFKVPNVGIVVSGIVSKGAIKIENGSGPVVWLGPFDKSGTFRKVQIRSIHTKSVLVQNVYAGQSATFAIKAVKSGKSEKTLRKNSINKGMVLLGITGPEPPKATEKFVAQMLILKHPTTIRTGYQPMAHIRTIRQTVSLENMNADCLRTGQSGRIQFRFPHGPQYINVGDHMIFREGQCRGIGVIRRVIHDEEEIKELQKTFEKKRRERKQKERVKNNVRPAVLPKKVKKPVVNKKKSGGAKKGDGK